MDKNLTVFIVDDNIFKSEELVNKSVYERAITSSEMKFLVNNFSWDGQYNLKELTSYILNSDSYNEGTINVYGFIHPSICLDEIENGLIPDIIIFDWEYGNEPVSETISCLKEILNIAMNTFVFIYSKERDLIPQYINKVDFDKDSDRMQLFLKGETNNSVFSSEEFILQYILARISNTLKIKVGGYDIFFNEKGYLNTPGNLLYLENIVGRKNLLEYLKNTNQFTENDVENIFRNNNNLIYFDNQRNLLIDEQSDYFIKKFNPQFKLTYLDVLKKYGINTLRDVLQTGLTKAV